MERRNREEQGQRVEDHVYILKKRKSDDMRGRLWYKNENIYQALSYCKDLMARDELKFKSVE